MSADTGLIRDNALESGLAAGIGGTMMLRLEVKQLRKKLDEALDKHQLKPPLAPWWCVDAAEARSMRADLREWVDGFARRHYPGYLARLRPPKHRRCWSVPRSSTSAPMTSPARGAARSRRSAGPGRQTMCHGPG
jgi:hypothetical protein